jgi:rhodanese-related sulfurtransferase
MADVRTITREDLKAKMDRGEDLVLLEVLGEGSYRQGHLPGAIRAQDQNAAMEVVPDRSAFVVAYCSNYN